jgi:hypothetical protein
MSLDGSASVRINGERRHAAHGTTLAELIADIGLDLRTSDRRGRRRL